MRGDVIVPATLMATVAGREADPGYGVSGDDWLAQLPRRVDEYLDRWGLQVDGAPRHGECALVLPVRDEERTPLALKLTWPHVEAAQEHLALRLWDGNGAVRLVAADPHGFGLLLERLDADRPLTQAPILEACEVIGDLMGELDRPATPQFRTLAATADGWTASLSAPSELVPRRLREQAASHLADLVGGASGRLVHEDLHDANVLGSTRRTWLAIDPKPVSGEWAYAVAPIVWNRPDAAARATSLRTHARLRAQIVADAAGLDLERVGAWTLVRLVLNAVWAARYAPASDEFRGRMIALAKAFTDPLD